MFQVRIHGRGGQGVVTAAEILSVAAFTEGRHAQAFPSFGSERMGAPVVSFCRIDDRPIRTREPVMEPDALVDPGRHADPPGRSLRRSVTRGLCPRQHVPQLRRARVSVGSPTGSAPIACSPVRRPSLPSSSSAGPCRTRRSLGGFAALTGEIIARRHRLGRPPALPGPTRRAERRRREQRLSHGCARSRDELARAAAD